MQELKDLYKDVIVNGEDRDTRTGKVRSVWDRRMTFDLQEGFPAVTSKQLAFNAVVGELLWFLSGSVNLSHLRHYTHGDCTSTKWTIWDDDCKRWQNETYVYGNSNYVGKLYPHQWRRFGRMEYNAVTGTSYRGGVDQINNLIDRLKWEPNRRDHIVMAWNPQDIEENAMALKPCHLGFQCYVDNYKRLHLKWWQRSADGFLGLPFNISSYALLTHLLAEWTGLTVGTLTGDLGDVHIYENHLNAMEEYLSNECHPKPKLVLPNQAKRSLFDCLQLTALDFKDCLKGYLHSGRIIAPLSVGN